MEMLKIVLLILVFITFCGFGTKNDSQVLTDEGINDNNFFHKTEPVTEEGEIKIEWMGQIVFSKSDNGIDFLTDTEIEIGLREDGIVVWRKKDK